MLAVNNHKVTVYVGSYAGTDAPNLYRFTFDSVSGALQVTEPIVGLENPSFFIHHPAGRYLYAAAGFHEGSIVAYRFDTTEGLIEINRQPVHGGLPCHLSINPDGSALFVTNYRSGNVALLPIRENGALDIVSDVSLHSGSGPIPSRQEEPHPHAVVQHPARPYAVVADLGIDRLIVYEAGPGQKSLKQVVDIALRSGMGPRHLSFHSTLQILYVIGELDSTVSVFSYSCDGLSFTEIQYISALPSGYTGINYCADIHVSPCGTFLYGSNRGHDSIAVFRIDPSNGTLSAPRHTHTGGKTPIAFALTPDGRFILVANKDSDSIVTLEVDPVTGELKMFSELTGMVKPTCIWMSREDEHNEVGFC
ncbi:6-phosphogluconolactonase [Paenibacillus sp. yr247]|uniref:lactonase family protein n=1 Tax=Paenibacillus sp. yr247 TaxID=1761880 RepID=UPI00088EDA2B|nr:lactonase family protein [Paenibacillus sp. yr247]SDO37946.1 6-phosphogluconolactonase [Paenibacillus sp. yr247]